MKEEEYTIEYLETNIPKDEPCLNSSNIEVGFLLKLKLVFKQGNNAMIEYFLFYLDVILYFL